MATDPDPCVIVIFGASGDLTARKLIPALYEMAAGKALPNSTCVLGVSRTEMDDDAWRDTLRPWVKDHAKRFDTSVWSDFAGRLHYLAGSATSAAIYPRLSERIEALSQQHQCRGNVLFYLAVAPSLCEPIAARLEGCGLVAEGHRWCTIDRDAMPWQRIIIRLMD